MDAGTTTQQRARRRGFRSTKMTEAQRKHASALASLAEAEGAFLIEVRSATYCGPGSAGDLGALSFSASFHTGGPWIQALWPEDDGSGYSTS